ncbi:MAG: hypothetical protein J5750_03665 [Clostridiales bacterium]|nr:hypothetical protein [Clostridiales bacterium]
MFKTGEGKLAIRTREESPEQRILLKGSSMYEYDKDELFQWHYGETEEEANRIASEIMEGKRHAVIRYFDWALGGSGNLTTAECNNLSNDRLQGLLAECREIYPKTGDINILTDWDGVPLCVIRTKGFGLMHLGDIPMEVAELELGETDKKAWQEKKIEEMLDVLPASAVNDRTIMSIEIIEVLEKLYQQ